MPIQLTTQSPSPLEDSLNRFCNQLRDPDRGVAARAVERITKLPPEATPLILEKIDALYAEGTSESHMAAADLIWSLGVRGQDDTATMHLEKYCQNTTADGQTTEPGVKNFSRWFRKRRGQDAVEPTIPQVAADFQSDKFFPPILAVLDLDLMGTPDTVPLLLEACSNTQTKSAPIVRGAAVWVLRNHLEEEGVLPALRRMQVEEPNREVRQIIKEALKGPLK